MASKSSEIQDCISRLKKYAEQNEECRAEVRDALELAASEIQTPFEQLLEITFAGPAMASALKTCLDMNLFALWEQGGGGPRTVDELAKMTQSDPILLARLLRHLAAMDKIREVGRDKFELTPFTQATGISNGIGLLYHSTWPAMQHLPKFLKIKGYQNPTDLNDTGWFHMTGSKVGWFEQLELDAGSGRLTDFQNTMEMYANAGNWAQLYPTETLFDGYNPEFPLLVDAGGGKGQDLERFLKKHPQPGKGSLVLEELPSVVDNIPYDHLDPSIKLIAHDLFQPQPIHGARAYFTHSVFHGWTNVDAVPVLKNFAAAMTKNYSKLLLNEKVVPAEKAPLPATTSDLYMMANFSASERTQGEWESLFDEAGLKLVKVWVTSIYPEAIIEAELK